MTMRHFNHVAAALITSTAAFAQGADDCAMAQPISGFGIYTFDTVGATTDGVADPVCSYFGSDQIFDDVWFSYTATASGLHLLSTCGSSGDSKIAVYDGTCGGTVLDCNDDTCIFRSEVRFMATAGQSYLLRLGNYGAGGGANGEFRISPDEPVLNPSNGHYYEVVREQWSWQEAESQAQMRIWVGAAGHLATITDQAELDWMLQNLGVERTWIGLRQNLASPTYSEPSGGWEWVTGEPFSFANWSTGEPNNVSGSGGPEDYAEMFANGAWNDAELFHANTIEYVVEWDAGGLGTNYCTANPNSTGATGVMSAAGSPAVADNDVTLSASGLPTASFGFFLTSQVQAFVANPSGSAGNLCVGGSIGRFVGPGQIQNTGQTGEISLAIDLTQFPSPTGPVAVQPGQSWNFQAWHRDSAGGTATSNFSDGLEVMFL